MPSRLWTLLLCLVLGALPAAGRAAPGQDVAAVQSFEMALDRMLPVSTGCLSAPGRVAQAAASRLASTAATFPCRSAAGLKCAAGAADEAVRGAAAAERGLTKATPQQLKAAGFQEHHIISDKNSLTKGHDLLRAAGFDLQSRANEIWLPIEASLHPTRSLHIGRHWNSVSGNLSAQMDEVLAFGRANGWNQQQFRAGLDAIIRDERALLRSGDRALNSIARPGAH